jgi:HNH endonuclease/helix-turn-helix protein
VITTSIADRFHAKVDVQGPEECWLWTAGRDQDGYGQLWDNDAGRSLRAHRVAYELANGPIPEGACVLHRCDNPPCCNPAHLFVGTNGDNTADMVAKGRHRPAPPGEHHPNARLSAAQVVAIRERYAQGGISQRALAQEVGIGQSQLNRILLGLSWRAA